MGFGYLGERELQVLELDAADSFLRSLGKGYHEGGDAHLREYSRTEVV